MCKFMAFRVTQFEQAFELETGGIAYEFIVTTANC